MEDETKILVEIRKNKKWDRSLILSVISTIIAIIAIIPQCVSCSSATKEKIQIKVERNMPFHVNIYKDSRVNSIEQVEDILINYIYSYATLSDYNIYPKTEIIANINNNSSFMIAVIDTKIYATNDAKDLNKIQQYEKLLEENRGLISGKEDKELRGFYDKFNCIVNDKDRTEFKPFGYTLNAGDIITKWLLVDFKFNDELEKELKEFMKQNIHRYNLLNIEDKGSYFECSEFETLLSHAMYDYCRKTDKSIYYTYQIKTSRGNTVTDEFPLFIP